MITKVHKLPDSDRKWYLFDAKGAILGRLATQIADTLRGKNKTTYTPNLDSGDNVIVINASKVALSKDDKAEKKIYYWHTGFIGGIKQETFAEAMEKHPERVIEKAVSGMMPKTKQAKAQLKRLKVYADAEHPHTQDIITVEGDK